MPSKRKSYLKKGTSATNKKHTISRNKFLEEFDGHELATDTLGQKFGERVTIGISKEDGGIFWKDGVKYKLTTSQIKRLWNEFWTSPEQEGYWLLKDAEKEFGGR